MALAALAAGVLGGAVAASPSEESSRAEASSQAGFTHEHAWFPTHDGVTLHASVFLPENRAEDEQHPLIMLITPYGNPNGGAVNPTRAASVEVSPNAGSLFENERFLDGRWGYVQVDVRGFGGSGGCFDYYSPNEALDTRWAIDWAGDQPWSTGDVALWGASYEAAQQVLALGSGSEHLAAAVIQAPGLSGYTALWHNGVHYATGRYGTTFVYTAEDLFPPVSAATATEPGYLEGQAASPQDRPECLDAAVQMNLVGDRSDPFWADREPYLAATGSDVPSFWFWGFHDANTKPVGFDVFNSLTGPKQAWFGQWRHTGGQSPNVGREDFLDQAFRFLDRHVLGIEGAQEVDGITDPVITVQSGGAFGEWRREEQWPPEDVVTWTMPLHDGTYADLPEAQTGGPADAGIWSATPPLPHAMHVAGEMEMTVTATTTEPGAHLVVRTYQFDERGNGVLVQRGATLLPDAGETTITFSLYPQDFRLEEGERFAVNVMASDDGWYAPGTSGTDVQITSATLAVPLLSLLRPDASYLDGDLSHASVSFPVRLAPSALEAAEVEGAVPPPMR